MYSKSELCVVSSGRGSSCGRGGGVHVCKLFNDL